MNDNDNNNVNDNDSINGDNNVRYSNHYNEEDIYYFDFLNTIIHNNRCLYIFLHFTYCRSIKKPNIRRIPSIIFYINAKNIFINFF